MGKKTTGPLPPGESFSPRRTPSPRPLAPRLVPGSGTGSATRGHSDARVGLQGAQPDKTKVKRARGRSGLSKKLDGLRARRVLGSCVRVPDPAPLGDPTPPRPSLGRGCNSPDHVGSRDHPGFCYPASQGVESPTSVPKVRKHAGTLTWGGDLRVVVRFPRPRKDPRADLRSSDAFGLRHKTQGTRSGGRRPEAGPPPVQDDPQPPPTIPRYS